MPEYLETMTGPHLLQILCHLCYSEHQYPVNCNVQPTKPCNQYRAGGTPGYLETVTRPHLLQTQCVVNIEKGLKFLQ